MEQLQDDRDLERSDGERITAKVREQILSRISITATALGKDLFGGKQVEIDPNGWEFFCKAVSISHPPIQLSCRERKNFTDKDVQVDKEGARDRHLETEQKGDVSVEVGGDVHFLSRILKPLGKFKAGSAMRRLFKDSYKYHEKDVDAARTQLITTEIVECHTVECTVTVPRVLTVDVLPNDGSKTLGKVAGAFTGMGVGGVAGVGTGAAVGGGVGALIGTGFFPVIGTVIGTGIGVGVGAVIGAVPGLVAGGGGGGVVGGVAGHFIGKKVQSNKVQSIDAIDILQQYADFSDNGIILEATISIQMPCHFINHTRRPL